MDHFLEIVSVPTVEYLSVSFIYNKCIYYVYILTNKNNNVLYIGITSNLVRRIYEHKTKLI